MAKNIHDLRFGIRREDGYVSHTWRLWITRSADVYLFTRGMAGIEKYSFHRSGICRSAFTKEHGTPRSMSDRALFKWTRGGTPPVSNGMASRVAWIAFPTDFLSRITEKNPKPTTWIPAAPSGGATYLELAYTSEPESAVIAAFQNNGRQLVSYTKLTSGDAFIFDYYYADWENRDLRIPASHGSVFPDLLFSASDPNDTGRPIRLKLGPPPEDGDALVLQELGGYKEMDNEPNNRLQGDVASPRT
jgi:hypothetical protein